MEFGVIGRTPEGMFPYQAWPTVARDDNGTLYVASSGHRLGHVCPFGKNYLYTSCDQGKTWTGPTVINDTCLDDRDAGLCVWGDGQMVLSWFNLAKEVYDRRKERTPALQTPLAEAARACWDTMPAEKYTPGAFVKVSTDGGKTWGAQTRVPVTSPHGPIRRKDGSLFFLGKIFMSQDEQTYPASQICAMESRDGGKTWQKLGLVEEPEGIDRTRVHEPSAVELPDGSILGAIRINGEQGAAGNTVCITRSADGGKTWTKPTLTGFCGTPPHLMYHSSGAVVMTYGRRAAPHGQRARISYDGGETWSEELTVGPESPDWDHGYPSSVELSDGSILTVYYQKCGEDPFNSILSTHWHLPDRT